MACRIQRITFEFPAKGDQFDPPTVAAVVTLVARGAAGKGGSGSEHEVSIRPATCAEFLVPRQKVLKVSSLRYSRALGGMD